MNTFFFIESATNEIYTLSLHDALPICTSCQPGACVTASTSATKNTTVLASAIATPRGPPAPNPRRSEEHTSELQSRGHLVCRLLLEKKKIGLKAINVHIGRVLAQVENV